MGCAFFFLVASLSLLYILKLIFFPLLLFSFLLISFQNFDFTKIIADDLKRNSDEENQSTTIRQLESRLSDTLIALKSTEARYKLTSQDSKRISDANDRLSRNLNVSKNEMETLRKQYDETRRNLLHLQRCARNAQVIEKNAARFLRDTSGSSAETNTSSNGSSSARGKLNGNKEGVNMSFPEISSPRVVSKTRGIKSKSSKKKSKPSKLGSTREKRPGSAPLRRRDQNS